MPHPSPRATRRASHAIACLTTALLLIAILGPAPGWALATGANLSKEQAARFAEQAEAWRRQLTDQVMPYWYDHSTDRDYGGYVLEDAISPEKLVVTQARLIWGFAHAYRLGLRDPKRDYLGAAEQGYRFLLAHFLDRDNGGYFWTTDRTGQPVDDRKFLYGQAFVILALVEYYQASGDRQALDHATELYRTVQAHCRDPGHGGWGEHFERDWKPLRPEETGTQSIVGITGPSAMNSAPKQATGRETRAGAGITGSSASTLAALLLSKAETPIGTIGMKSGDALLHWMEALTELDRITRVVSGDAAAHALGLDSALAEALDLNMTYFFPAKPGEAYPYRDPDWRRPIGARFMQISYGHNVEFAWLMLAAERALGRPPSWDRFDALVQHALAHAFDRERGGLYELGFDDRPAIVTDKVWWIQAELLAALTESLSQRPNPDYAAALDRLLGFLTAHQIDPQDGLWYDTVAADGSLRRPEKAHDWKANYHDLRAMMKFVQTFGAGFGAGQAKVH
jgi:mannobiose 2-epimerase